MISAVLALYGTAYEAYHAGGAVLSMRIPLKAHQQPHCVMMASKQVSRVTLRSKAAVSGPLRHETQDA